MNEEKFRYFVKYINMGEIKLDILWIRI